eukprot:g3491.t1
MEAMGDFLTPAMKSALLSWVQTFDSLSHSPTKLSDLADGIILFEIGNCISETNFDMSTLKRDVADNWLFRAENLRKVLSGIKGFTEDHLGRTIDIDKLGIDTAAVARGGTSGAGEKECVEICKLTSRLLGCAVQCEDKGAFVNEIMRLDQNHQAQLMLVIDSVVNSGGSVSPPTSPTNGDGFEGSFGDEHDLLDFDAMEDEAEDDFDNSMVTPPNNTVFGGVSGGGSNLEKENSKLRRNEKAMLAQIAELQAANARLTEEALHLQSADKEKAARDRAKEEQRIKAVKNALSKREVELTSEMENLSRTLEETRREMTATKRRTDLAATQAREENRALADELDILRTKQTQNSKLEQQLEQYKRKLEDAKDLETQMKELEAKNNEYLNKMLDMEADVETLPAIKEQLAKYKEQLIDLKTTTSRFQMQITEKDHQLLAAQEESRRQAQVAQEAAAQRAAAEDQARGLLKQLEMAKGSGSLGISGNSGSGGASLSASLAASGGGTAVLMSLKEKVGRLERENKRLKSSLEEGASKDDSVATLESQLEESRRDVLVLKGEVKKLRAKAERAEANRSASDGSGAASTEEHRKVMERCRALEETVAQHQLQVTELASYKDVAEDLTEKLKEKQAALDKRAMEQQKLENYVKQALGHANNTVKQSQLKYKNSLRMLKQQIEAKQKEIQYFSRTLEKAKMSHKREERLLMSALYRMGMEMNSRFLQSGDGGGSSSNGSGSGYGTPTASQGNNTLVGSAAKPTSWLGQRRLSRRRTQVS